VRKLVTAVLAAATMWMFIRAADMQILMKQEIVQSGERLILDGWGDLGTSGSASLVCRYFTGLGTTTIVFWYSPDNGYGRNSCAVVHKELYSLRR